MTFEGAPSTKFASINNPSNLMSLNMHARVALKVIQQSVVQPQQDQYRTAKSHAGPVFTTHHLDETCASACAGIAVIMDAHLLTTVCSIIVHVFFYNSSRSWDNLHLNLNDLCRDTLQDDHTLKIRKASETLFNLQRRADLNNWSNNRFDVVEFGA